MLGHRKTIQVRDGIRLFEQRNDSFGGGPQHSSGGRRMQNAPHKWNVSTGAVLSPKRRTVIPREHQWNRSWYRSSRLRRSGPCYHFPAEARIHRLSATHAPVAQLDRASDYGSEGWGFEFSRACQRTSLAKHAETLCTAGGFLRRSTTVLGTGRG